MGRTRISSKGLLLLFISLFLSVNLYAQEQTVMTRKCPSGLEVIMVFDADKLVTMQPVTTTLKILDPQGAPISNALVYCSFYIPNFATGANSPKIKATDQNGLYEGLVFFTHEGRWNVDLTINLPNGGYEEVTFNIDQVLPNPTISAL